jgi:glycosyltransferase involved in cell wall biosynthesis
MSNHRIAYVSADLGVPIFGRKGCSIHAQEVLQTLVRRGAQVELFSTSVEGECGPGLAGIKVHSLPRPAKGDPAGREKEALAGNFALTATLEAAGPVDLLYERYSLWSYAAMEHARATGVPGLLEVNAPLIDEQAQYRVLVDRPAAEKVATRVFGAASALLAVSDEVANWLETFPGARGKIHVVPNGIRTERFPDWIKPSLPAPGGVFTVGFVGTLKAWHGLDVLAEAFALLHAQAPATRLLIVGDGPERDKMMADLNARGLSESTVFPGAVAPEQVPGLMASMDAAVAPYPRLERFYFSPLKVFEYMAAGRAVVASGIGQLRKVIEPEITGLLVEPGDAKALVAAILRLRNDAALCKRLGQAARSLVLRQYTWDSVVDRIYELGGLQSAGEQLSPSLAGGSKG